MNLSTLSLIILLCSLKCVTSFSHKLKVTSAAECRQKCHSRQYKCQFASFHQATSTCFISEGKSQSGVYAVDLGSRGLKNVSCHFMDGEAWTVVLRRTSDSLNFIRSWESYRTGFEDSENVWIGLDALHILTTASPHKALIILEKPHASGNLSGNASYDTISVSSETDHFRLTISGYSGNVGDAMAMSNGMAFSTYDTADNADSDGWADGSCVRSKRVGWWYMYTSCYRALLTGLYQPGLHGPADLPQCNTYCAIQWNKAEFKYTTAYDGLSFVEMLIAPN